VRFISGGGNGANTAGLRAKLDGLVGPTGKKTPFVGGVKNRVGAPAGGCEPNEN
jgi:hypothetical protein